MISEDIIISCNEILELMNICQELKLHNKVIELFFNPNIYNIINNLTT
jgi:hypothetical protein